MKGLFRELLTEIRRVNPSSAGLLRPGLSRDLIEKKLATLAWEISPDAVSLYEWADGANAGFEVLPGAYFIPLDEALRQFKAFQKVVQQMDEEEEPYRENLRFLSDWSDGGYAFGRLDSPSKGRIIKLCIHATWLIGFADLEHLLRTSIEAYRQGIMRSGDDLPDFKRFRKLAGQLNPGYKVWHSTLG